VIIREIV